MIQVAKRTLATSLVVTAMIVLGGCAGLVTIANAIGVVPDKEFKPGMTRADVEQRLGDPITGQARPDGRTEYYLYLPAQPENVKEGLKLIGFSALTGFLAEVVLTPAAVYANTNRLQRLTAITYDSADRITVVEPNVNYPTSLPLYRR